ncbi:uncharacterized protein LOC18434752 [Amborella trichopoda]|uniref:C2H2-type domain-containing protein n=1 Tax=Amborella trichopoda TaxID=13333 RepID=W1PF06_AMBTC|nr:uncharacterized protein LOC18434752 [Amborella trichopoda]ERN06553.1 hypothetical protein AMTR_s00058p00118540 [Amborella trichopoda]|eukprot:XP_020523264.1 uncharacterized protein LOC18434752 [Amborella trichopoda]
MEPFISDFSNFSGSEAKPVSIDGNQSTPNLTIRLKVGKKTDSQWEISSPEPATSQFDQVAGVLGHYSCKFCNLKFGSKRSLEAHVKTHAKHSNYGLTNSDEMGLKDERERRKEGCRGEGKSSTTEETTKHKQQEPVCAVCKKRFPSMKSLFGHMRCHPKRVSRRIQPPKIKNSSNGAQMKSTESLSYHTDGTVTEESSKVHNPLSPHSNWSVTGSRRRRNKTTSSESKDLQRQRFEGVSKGMKETVRHLPMLSQSQRNLEELGFLEKQETDKEGLESNPEKSKIVHESSSVYSPDQWKKKTKLKREVRAMETATNSGKPHEGEIISNCNDAKKRKLFIGISAANNSEEEEVTKEDAQYLGIGPEISVAFLKESGNKRQKTSRISANFSPDRQGSHICTKCDQRFNSGQALGGHMRKHFDREKHLAKLKVHHSSKMLTMGSQVELRGARKNGGGARRNGEGMEFMDLNGVMPIADEDLKFALSMLEVVPAYADYVRSRLFMISEA